MGVPLYCCSKTTEEKYEKPCKDEHSLIDDQNLKNLQNKTGNIFINPPLINIQSITTGTTNLQNITSIKQNNNEKYENSHIKLKKKIKQLPLKYPNINKKCTYDNRVQVRHTSTKSKKQIQAATSLLTPKTRDLSNRFSHIIDFKHLESTQSKKNLPVKSRLTKTKTDYKNDKKSNDGTENKTNDSKVGKDSLIKKTFSKNNSNKKLDVQNELEANNIPQHSIIKEKVEEEDEEDDEEDEAADDKFEIIYFNELKHIKSIPRPKLNTLPIEVIHEPFTPKQLKNLKKIMKQEELIVDEMDDSIINKIIGTVTYIKVKRGVNIYSRGDKLLNLYYMLDKGRVEYSIDNDKYQLPKHCGIGTNALHKNSVDSCSLFAVEKSYLFKLDIEKYKTIVKKFFEEQHDIKYEFLTQIFFFNGLKKSLLDKVVDASVKKIYNTKTVLVGQDEVNENIYIIIVGHVLCLKEGDVIKILNKNDMFGEIGIYNSAISLYEYTADPDTEILSINFEDLYKALGKDTPKLLMQKIFEKAVKENEILSKYFLTGDNMDKIFNISQIKYYFNDIVCGNKEKKIFIPVSGSVFKVVPQFNLDEGLPETLLNQQMKTLYRENSDSFSSSKIYSKINSTIKKKKLAKKKKICKKGKLNIDSITVSGRSRYYILGDECLIIEANWIDIEKNIIIPNEETRLSLNQRINLIKPIDFFKYLTPLQIFQLSNFVHYHQYKYGKIILENGPNSDKLYLIKSGIVQMSIGDVMLKSLYHGMTFGDIRNDSDKSNNKANYIAASGKVECYYIEKENYEDIMDKDILTPLKKFLTNNNQNSNISLELLYYIKDLGKGAYGKVFLVHDSKNFYAMKTADIQQLNEMKEAAKLYISEKNIMFSIKHPFIVSIINTFKTREFLFFLLEYVDGISLRTYINKNNRELKNLKEAKFFTGSMALVLHYLQKQKIIHRDLKPDNIMLEYTGYLKVIDFGVAIDITGKDYASTLVGTMHYMAPEIILRKNYNNAVDYWSVGIILYEMVYGQLPFGQGERDPIKIYAEITNKKLYLPSDSESLNEVVKGLLAKNPQKRLANYNMWKNYKMFNGFDFDKLLNLEMKGFFQVEKNLTDDDINNKDVSFIDYLQKHLFYTKNEVDEIIRNKKKNQELLEDF